MVDPKRHINILSPEEQAFLEECENEFAHRFTDLDEEFMAHCQRPSKPPPIVQPWNNWRGGGRGGGGRGGRGGVAGWRGERRVNDRSERGGRNHSFHGYRRGYRPYDQPRRDEHAQQR
uniref:RNMT-activating mini protein n=1 Tax=Anopheles epiroticus TaxID=199890 RepID=A0A182PYL3_9DIPT